MGSPQVASRDVYDAPSLIFHWLTVVFVLALFGLALVWNFVPALEPYWSALQFIHVSIGILFAILILARIVWRLTGARRQPPHAGLNGVIARLMYGLLYVLLVAQIGLGFTYRWLEGEPVSFFGLFAIPAPFAANENIEHLIGRLHNWTGWAIVILAFGHAGAALVHHYILKDGTLKRMLLKGSKSAEIR